MEHQQLERPRRTQERDDADLLAAEWATYRAACDAVDAARASAVRNPGSGSEIEVANAVWEQRRVRQAYTTAVAASRALLTCAETLDVDPLWLAALRASHRQLQRDAQVYAERADLTAGRLRELREAKQPKRRR